MTGQASPQLSSAPIVEFIFDVHCISLMGYTGARFSRQVKSVWGKLF